MGSWAVQDAKAKFSELLETAEQSGPQTITRRGVEKAVLVPIDKWRQMTETPKPTLIEILMSGPKFDLPIPPRGKLRHRKTVKL